MVGHGTSAAELRENMLGDASMVDAVSLSLCALSG